MANPLEYEICLNSVKFKKVLKWSCAGGDLDGSDTSPLFYSILVIFDSAS